MLFFKTKKEEDPYYKIWKSDKWLHPIENADKFRFPMTITSEPTNYCTNKCLFCSRQLMKRELGYMTLECMENLIRECSKHGAAVRHGGMGEPLMHPQIEEMVALSNKYKVLTTIFTNGTNLTEENARSFIGNGLDEMRFSSSGISAEVHNFIREGSDYKKDFDEKLKMVHRLKKEMKSNKPYLTVYATVLDYKDETFRANIDRYVKYYLNYVDKVDIDLTGFSRVKHLYHAKDLYKKQTIRKRKRCLDLFLKLIVHWNGDFFVCDRLWDYEETYFLGNLNKGQKIEDGWKSEKIKKLRNELSFDTNHENYSLCKDCFSNTNKWENKN